MNNKKKQLRKGAKLPLQEKKLIHTNLKYSYNTLSKLIVLLLELE